jgi:long-chain acyl-CoA synthetase
MPQGNEMKIGEADDRFEPTPRRFVRTALARGNAVAWRSFDGKAWSSRSWTDYLGDVRTAARALVALGVVKGEVVCILGYNRPEWTTVALAAMMVGATPTGIYFTSSAEEVAYILDHSRAAVLIVETADHLARIGPVRGELKHLRHIVTMRGAAADPGAIGWQDFLDKGGDSFSADVELRLAALTPGDMGTLIYTSGTTGPPKAVMLSHGAMAWTASTSIETMNIGGEHRILSYLPLAHIAEAMFSIHNHALGGCELWFARSLEELGAHLRDCRPTVFFGVPRVWQKMHEAMTARLAQATGVKASLAKWAFAVGHAHAQTLLASRSLPPLLALQHRIADRLVLQKIRQVLGLDKCAFAASGSAPITRNVLDFFASLGIVICEVYGQSEGCGPTTMNRPGAIRLGTVGKPLPDVELKIADDAEILARGPNLFDGYLHDSVATDATLCDGWMRTGDLGRLDPDGFLTIIGRKKEILITSGGKKIAVANLEQELMQMPLVEHAIVVGEGRNFVGALVTLAPDRLAAFAAANGISGDPRKDTAVLAEVQRGLDAMNARYARAEQVRRFAVLPASLSIDGGELTPTLKVKRAVVAKKYADMIGRLYAARD